MYIQKIKINKFKSFYEPYELNFDEVKGLWKVSGSVGSGKTSIGEAILFGLFGSITGKNNADLVSWGQKSTQVELWCKSKSRNIYIKRDIYVNGTSSIYVEIDGEELIFTNKRDAQQQLETEYYDVSKVTMELLCIISFNNFKSLATLTATDTKKFLDQVLGFYTLTEYVDVCKQFKNDNLSQINQVSSVIGKLESQVKKLEELSNTEVISGDINIVKQEIKNLLEHKDTIEKEFKLKLIDKKEEKQQLDKKKITLVTLGKNKKNEIDFIEKGVCPTCGAAIDQSQLEIKKQERLLLLEQYEEIKAKSDNVYKEIVDIDNEYSNSLKLYKEQIDDTKTLLTRLEEQAKRIKINISEIESIKENIISNEKLLDELQIEDASWDRLCNILSNEVRARILDSFIPALNNNIMKYAQELHQPYIVSFDNNFKCSVSLCGYNENIPISSLSTGQLKTVDMMIILGVLGTIIGANSANIIFLDELFSNLDGGLRNDMCSVLHNFISKDDTMFVISHQDLDEKYFNGTLKLHIDYKGQYEKHSSVTLISN